MADIATILYPAEGIISPPTIIKSPQKSGS